MFRGYGTALLFLVLMAGCGKPSSSHETPDPAAADSLAPAGGNVTVEPQSHSQAVPPPVDHMPTVLAHLTQAVRKYAAEKQKVPAGLEELVANGYLSRMPEALAGKRFAINQKLQVYLADQ